MSINAIDQKLIEYLNTPMPSYAVLLRGKWGVGKSYYWQQFKNRAMPEGKGDITFSVAGLSTLEELERGLFLASIKDFGPGLLKETGTVVGRALLRWAKVEPNDIKLKADVRPDHTVVCIDDIERFGGEFKVLFGFVLSLLDDANLHVILIADEERALALPGYRDYRERIISRSFDVPPDIEGFYEHVVNGYVPVNIRKVLLDAKSHALELFKQKSLNNLRTVRAILDQINVILSGMRWPQGNTVSLSRLLSAVTFHAMAVNRDPVNEPLVSRAFRQSDLGMILALHSSGRKRKAEASGEEATGMCNLIHSLGFQADAYDWPSSLSFAALVQGQSYDPNSLALEFDLFGNAAEEDQPLLVQFRSYRSMTEERFREAVVQLYGMIDGSTFQSLQEMWTVFEILYHLSQQRVIKDTPEQCRDMFLAIINAHDPAGAIEGNLEIWQESRDGNEVAVIKALQDLDERVRAETRKRANKLLQQAIIDGVGDEPQDACLPAFVGENPSDVLARLRAVGRPGIYRMSRFYRRRLSISNYADFTRDEIPFARGLMEAIASNPGPGGQLTLDEAAFRELENVLRRFVDGAQPSPSQNQEGTGNVGP